MENTHPNALNNENSNIFISPEVIVEEGAVIMPFVVITGRSVIRKGSIIHSFTTIEDSVINENCSIGPSARLRPETVVEKNCRIGNFVEIKNSIIGEGSKVAHLAYVGDARIGKNCNVGCGVVFCNFDGKKKYKTTVGNDCFIGSNVNLIAPLCIGNHAFIAAGVTVSQDVEQNAFIVGDRKVKIKENRC